MPEHGIAVPASARQAQAPGVYGAASELGASDYLSGRLAERWPRSTELGAAFDRIMPTHQGILTDGDDHRGASPAATRAWRTFSASWTPAATMRR